jgi:hypothetical protein
MANFLKESFRNILFWETQWFCPGGSCSCRRMDCTLTLCAPFCSSLYFIEGLRELYKQNSTEQRNSHRPWGREVPGAKVHRRWMKEILLLSRRGQHFCPAPLPGKAASRPG